MIDKIPLRVKTKRKYLKKAKWITEDHYRKLWNTTWKTKEKTRIQLSGVIKNDHESCLIKRHCRKIHNM